MVTYPKDWEIVPLSECVTGKLSYGINKPAIPYNSGYPAYIRITDITDDGKYSDSDRKSVATTQEERYEVKIGDILLARTGASTGKSYLYNEKDGKLVYAGFLIKASIDCTKHNPRFIVGQLRTKRYWEWVSATSMRSGQPGINGKEYASFLIPVTTKQEEDSIAATLSTFDTHIDNLAALIEKKKAIRDGALEDLMSGKTRLEGFSEEWGEYKFDDYFTLIPNNTLSRDKLTNSGVIGDVHYGDVLIKYGDILSDKDEIPKIKNVEYVKDNNFLQTNDVIIADTAEDETVGKVVQIGKVSIPLVSGLHTVACRPNYKTALGFLGYYMNSNQYHNQLYQYITGIKVSSLSKKSLKDTVLTIPADANEQKAIADILTSMDTEIQNLETERDKFVKIREGAMDDLLTGRVRLPI